MPKISVDVEIDVSIWCARCGAGLCNQSSPAHRTRETGFDVSPCEACIESEIESVRDEMNTVEQERDDLLARVEDLNAVIRKMKFATEV